MNCYLYLRLRSIKCLHDYVWKRVTLFSLTAIFLFSKLNDEIFIIFSFNLFFLSAFVLALMLYSQLLLYTLFFQFLILLFSVPEFQIFLLKETDSVFYILFIHLTFIAVKGRYNVSVMHQIICIIVLAVFSQKFQHIFFKINFSTFLNNFFYFRIFEFEIWWITFRL